ncbi:MAG TPA: efflux transporter periplasmic adaptor subunit, partial [Verrucomicrobiota bacterium]|nr:efflux transporter periplasmic adaptor subunit [Verrucomicrobiota bacterium]
MITNPSTLPSSGRSFKWAAVGLASLLTLLSTTACDKEKAAPPAPPVVNVVSVAQRDVPVYMEWIGSLDGNVNAVIRPQVT